MATKQLQLGKKGLTKEFLQTLKTYFENSKNVKISVLKSSCRDKRELKQIENKILNFLGKNYTSKTIGYTINLKKWRKPLRELS